MQYLATFVVILSVCAEALGENNESRLKKRGIYGEGLLAGIGLDSASIGSLGIDSSLGNTALISGLNSGLNYGGAYGYGYGGTGLGGISLSGLNGGAGVIGAGGGIVSKQITVQNNVAVPVPQPYAVPVTRTVAVPVPQPIRIPVDRPYPVRVPHPVPVPVDRPYPVAVDKPYPVPVPQPYPVRVLRPVPYPVPRPVPVPVVNTVPVPVPQAVAVGSSLPALSGSSLGGYGLSLGSGLSGASLGLSSSGLSIPSLSYGHGGLGSYGRGGLASYGGLYSGKVVGLGPHGW